MNPTVRKAGTDEMHWVNERYKEVGFTGSDHGREVIAIAEVDGERAGLGRLIKVDDSTLELGGMYVLEEFRGKNLAHQIVSFLLEHWDGNKKVFCLPFAHLSNFYAGFGFRPCVESDAVPESVSKKHQWCNSQLGPTLLYILDRK